MSDRPNVLLVTTDQQSAGTMSCAGNDAVETPAMDRLAESGIRFAETYCPYPLCGPSRASLFTGRIPHTVGITSNEDRLEPDERARSLGRLFADAGYDCGYAGKWHLPEFSLPADNDFGFERLCAAEDPAVARACAEFMARDRDEPFLLVASFDNPHNICEWSREQNLPWGNIDRAPPRECPSLPSNFAIPPYEPACIRRELERRPVVQGAMLGRDEDDWRQYRHAYYRLVEQVDREIQRVLDGLDDSGAAENTVVVFTSDHGDGNGSHQLKEKGWLYEEQTRVPLVIRHPDETPRGHVDDEHLVSNGLDLLPTLCDYADIDVPGEKPGRSLRPLATDTPNTDWRDHLVVETYAPLEGRMVRTDRHKYVVYERGHDREQLFDMTTDRDELVDLSVNAAYDDVLADHRERLLEWCIDTDDAFGNYLDYPPAPRIPGYEYLELRERFVDDD